MLNSKDRDSVPWWSQWFETEEEMLDFYCGWLPTQEETLTNLTDILKKGNDNED